MYILGIIFLLFKNATGLHDVPMVNLTIITMIPTNDNGCTESVFKMAYKDVYRHRQQLQYIDPKTNLTQQYNFIPLYLRTSEDPLELMTKLNQLYSQGEFQVMIGPPFTDQTTFSYSMGLATIMASISYTAPIEPVDITFELCSVIPPSITTMIPALKSFLSLYNWTRISVVTDYSEDKYRSITGTLISLMKKPSNKSKSIGNIEELEIYKLPPRRKVTQAMDTIEMKGIRVNVLLASIGGARKVFCEAYHRQLYKRNILWILFEILPRGWASEKYNSLKGKDAMEREVNCTEDELLKAADGYVSIIGQGLRRDNKRTISSMTADDFRLRLIKAVGNDVECDENVAYAYDAVWLMAKSFSSVNFKPVRKLKYRNLGILMMNGAQTAAFEGLSGPLSFKQLTNIPALKRRVGEISLFYNRGYKSIYIGTHKTTSDILYKVTNIESILFKGGVPWRDGPDSYINVYKSLSTVLVYTMWTTAGLCIIIVFILSLVSLYHHIMKFVVFDNPVTDLILIFGAILCYVSLILYGVDTNFIDYRDTPSVCTTFISFLSIGFMLCFGSLFAKLWRMYKLSMKIAGDKLKTRKEMESEFQEIAKWKLWLIIWSLLVIDVVILAIWFSQSPLLLKIFDVTGQPDQFNDVIYNENLATCQSKHQTEFFIVSCTYKGILLIIGIFITWQTNSSEKMQAECKDLQMAVYNIGAVSIIGVVCSTILMDTTQINASYAIVSICILLSTTTTLFLVFGRQLINIWRIHFGGSKSSRKSSSKFSIKNLRKITKNEKGRAAAYTQRPMARMTSTDSEASKRTLSVNSNENTEIERPPLYQENKAFETDDFDETIQKENQTA